MVAAVQPFHYIHEREDPFLSLFPHRFDYIYAPYPAPGASPHWHTERRYPLSDRMISQGDALYGVRFGKTTQYALIDIDTTSVYHPQRNPFAIPQLLDALEPLGLVKAVVCTSSDSGGIHLYLPFSESCVSWKLAIALSSHLERAGFCVKPGQLELFPNVRPFSAQLALFHAHRLPLQSGSYLLDEGFQPIWSSKARFVQQWQHVQQQNTLDLVAVARCVAKQQRSLRPVSNRAEKFLADLNLDIEQGWTGRGQTNHLLGRIALRTYVFHHVLEGGEPLSGKALTEQIVAIAQSLPGYSDWCAHQHELEKRAEEWTRCVEASRYFPYGVSDADPEAGFKFKNSTPVENSVNRWNTQQEKEARKRIKEALTDLLNRTCLPSGITDRFKALVSYGIGGSSLYRHKDLWHPQHIPDLDLESSLLEEAGRNSIRSEACNAIALEPSTHQTDRNSPENGPSQAPSISNFEPAHTVLFCQAHGSELGNVIQFLRRDNLSAPPPRGVFPQENRPADSDSPPVENSPVDSS